MLEAVGDMPTTRLQVREAGSFTWDANDPGCLVIQESGAGEVALPFAHGGGGDTDAFVASGRIAVEAVDFQGASGCDIVLHDAGDGRQLDFGEVLQGAAPLLLEELASRRADSRPSSRAAWYP